MLYSCANVNDFHFQANYLHSKTKYYMHIMLKLHAKKYGDLNCNLQANNLEKTASSLHTINNVSKSKHLQKRVFSLQFSFSQVLIWILGLQVSERLWFILSSYLILGSHRSFPVFFVLKIRFVFFCIKSDWLFLFFIYKNSQEP